MKRRSLHNQSYEVQKLEAEVTVTETYRNSREKNGLAETFFVLISAPLVAKVDDDFSDSFLLVIALHSLLSTAFYCLQPNLLSIYSVSHLLSSPPAPSRGPLLWCQHPLLLHKGGKDGRLEGGEGRVSERCWQSVLEIYESRSSAEICLVVDGLKVSG